MVFVWLTAAAVAALALFSAVLPAAAVEVETDDEELDVGEAGGRESFEDAETAEEATREDEAIRAVEQIVDLFFQLGSGQYG